MTEEPVDKIVSSLKTGVELCYFPKSKLYLTVIAEKLRPIQENFIL